MRDTRIQKVLSELGLCSRRAAEQIIQEGRVTLNGRPVQLGDKMDPLKDHLAVDGQTVRVPKKSEHYYYMLHKPRGYVTTMSDERGRKTVVELLEGTPVRVYPIGRLDKDSEGLLLFTNDGDFANMLSHPSHGVSKTYRVTVHPAADENQILELAQGVVLDDGVRTQPATVRVAADEAERTVLEITIKEGKNRQIRRMCEAVGLEVARLRRISYGPVRLGMLAPGKYRELTGQEVAALRASAQKVAKVNAHKAAEEKAAARKAAQGRGGSRAQGAGRPAAAKRTQSKK
ncbi:MAG: rRNA pseudouridine synthase [Oscillospiraceae bacterium]|nr:rRNA pseudouridine synthase [Oscillospiraceae bacterium]